MYTWVCWSLLIACENMLHSIKYSKEVFTNFGTQTLRQWHNGSQQDSAEPGAVPFTDVTYNSPSSSSSLLICRQHSTEDLINNSYSDLFTVGGQQIVYKRMWLRLRVLKRFQCGGVIAFTVPSTDFWLVCKTPHLTSILMRTQTCLSICSFDPTGRGGASSTPGK